MCHLLNALDLKKASNCSKRITYTQHTHTHTYTLITETIESHIFARHTQNGKRCAREHSLF